MDATMPIAPLARLRLRYAGLGLAAGALAFALSASVAKLCMVLLPVDMLGKSAAAATVNSLPSVLSLFLMVAIIGPVYETIIAQWAPVEILRKFGAGKWPCIGVTAALFGIGHYLNGGLLHGLTAFCAGLIFGYAYLRVRANGVGTSFSVAALAHMTNNALALTMGLWFPSLF